MECVSISSGKGGLSGPFRSSLPFIAYIMQENGKEFRNGPINSPSRGLLPVVFDG